MGIPREVADAIQQEAITLESDFAHVVQVLGSLNNSQVNRALIDLSPALFGSLEWINARNNNYVADLLAQHLFELRCSTRDCCNLNLAWLNVFGNFMDNKHHFDNLSRFNGSTGGVLAGLDYCFSAGISLGGSVGYSYTNVLWKRRARQRSNQ